MRTWIVLLRGINVGGANKLPMKDLREALPGAGFEDVATYIQSGNIVLRSKLQKSGEVAGEVANIIQRKFGFRPQTMAISRADMAKAFDANPYSDGAPKAVHLFFMEKAPTSPDLEALQKLATTEEFHLAGPVFYLHTPDGIGRSKLGAAVEKRLGQPATARNLNTVAKLIEMAQESEGS